MQAETKLIVTIGIFVEKWAGTSPHRMDGAVSKRLAATTVTVRYCPDVGKARVAVHAFSLTLVSGQSQTRGYELMCHWDGMSKDLAWDRASES